MISLFNLYTLSLNLLLLSLFPIVITAKRASFSLHYFGDEMKLNRADPNNMCVTLTHSKRIVLPLCALFQHTGDGVDT